MKKIIFSIVLIASLFGVARGVDAISLQQSGSVSPNAASSLQGGANYLYQDTGTDNSTLQANPQTSANGTFSKQSIMLEADPNTPKHPSHWLAIAIIVLIGLFAIFTSYLVYRGSRRAKSV